MYKAILFDMDGTLHFMNPKQFLGVYLKELMAAIAPLGLDPDVVMKGFSAGIRAMRTNDGTRTNGDAYWDTFCAIVGGDAEEYKRVMARFYETTFDKTRETIKQNPDARRALDVAKRRGARVVLATSPLFPHLAQVKRLNWGGFEESEFEFITDHDSDSFCKPNPAYFTSVCQRLGLDASECLMVGNDVSDDMRGAEAAGLGCYLVTDDLLEDENDVWQGARGSMAELAEFIENM